MIQDGDQLVLQKIYFATRQNISHNPITHGHAPLTQDFTLGFAILPAAIAICILFIRVLQPLARKRSLWMRNFITEPSTETDTLGSDTKPPSSHYSTALLAIILAGLTLQIVAVLYPTFCYEEVFPTTAWVMLAS